MFPVNFVNASGSSSQKENVSGNKGNKLNNSFECYNVGPSYWAEREREVFNTQNRNVAAELNKSSSSGSVNVFNSSFTADTNCSDIKYRNVSAGLNQSFSGSFNLFNTSVDVGKKSSEAQSRKVPVGSKHLSSSGRFVLINSSRKCLNSPKRNVPVEANRSLNDSFNFLNSSFTVSEGPKALNRNVSFESNAGSRKKKSRPPGRKTQSQAEINMDKVAKRMEKAIMERKKKARKVNPIRSAFSNIDFVTLWLLNSEDETAQVGELYKFVEYHFPCIRTIDHWRNTIRNALSKNQGFQRVQNEGFSQKRGFWQFAPESKERLIISVKEKINANRENLKKLRMRNLEDLSAILEGKCPAPTHFESNEQILNVSTSDVSFNTSYSTINESFQNSEIGDLPEDFLDFEPSTSPECSYSEHTYPILYNSIPSPECVTKENDENVKPDKI